ncbi:MAG: tRNA (adenosine(37)-N6)-dimethylallyltransferase MiaA [Ignavibacteriales bacterium]|nr:tRNA (adenosine(37)-N6)-dimethylallyltransferase MiaA [Ignavibacteriales bacterium]
MHYNLLSIIGPTACGKTRLAVALALHLNGEIISADSRQVYRELTIGTGKDLDEYIINNQAIPYHLIDIISASETYDVFSFHADFFNVFRGITIRNKLPVLCGGTGLYISSVLENYHMPKVDFTSPRAIELNAFQVEDLRELLIRLKPGLHNTTDLTEKLRTIKAILIAEAELKVGVGEKNIIPEDIHPLIIGLAPERELVKQRITARLKQRLQNGMITEVEQLINAGFSVERLDFFGLEYRYLGKYLTGELTYDAMFEKLNSSIHNFAKRQMTWLRRMEKHGVKIHWFTEPDVEAVIRLFNNPEIV